MTIEYVHVNGSSPVTPGEIVFFEIYPGETDDNYRVARILEGDRAKPFETGTVVVEPEDGDVVSGDAINTDPRLRGRRGSLRFTRDN